MVSGVTRELHYIVAYGQIVAIFEKKSSGETNMYYVHTDHLGSLNVLTDESGNITPASGSVQLSAGALSLTRANKGRSFQTRIV